MQKGGRYLEVRISECQTAPIRVLIVGDHVILRQGISVMLQENDEFEVVGEVATYAAALVLTRKSKPDIALIDISLETCSGLDTAKLLLRSSPDTRIVLFAGSNDKKQLFDALRIGVHGYLQKTLSIDNLRKALQTVQRGERVLGEAQAVTQVVHEFHRLVDEQNRLNYGLSETDVEILRLASKGQTNKEIGKQLSWSEIWVKRKMQDIYRKLQVADRAQAVAEAIHLGLI
jgi:NarL family two-component system response regulator LiaR